MPIEIHEGKTPKGTRCMRALVSGQINLADADAMGALVLPGQPYHQALILCVVAKGTEYSPDSRRRFEAMNGDFKLMASVVTSGVVRAAINFMLRLNGGKAALRLFNTEADALAWLDGG